MNTFKYAWLILFIHLSLANCFAQVHYDPAISEQINQEKEHILEDYKKEIKKGKMPFDGEWTDAWNNTIISEKGYIFRHYTEKYLGGKLKYDVGIIPGTKYIEPGIYKSDNSNNYVKIISNNQILVIGEMSDYVLVKVKLKDEKWFERESRYFLEKNKKRTPAPPYIIIENVQIKPETVAPGRPFDILVDYRAADTGNEKELPVNFSYSIIKDGEKLLQSPQSELAAPNGKLMNRKVLMHASQNTGTFDVLISMNYKKLRAVHKARFRISDDPLQTKKVLSPKDIEGKYIMAFGSKNSNLDIINTGNGLKINHYNPGNKMGTIPSYKFENNVLTFIEKVGGKDTDCWYQIKNEIDFSSPADEKPLKSTILDGNWCVMIGQTFKGTLKKKE